MVLNHPTKKDITFTLAMWKHVTILIDEIDQAAQKPWAEDPETQQKRWHLGTNVSLSVNPAYSVVDIRQF